MAQKDHIIIKPIWTNYFNGIEKTVSNKCLCISLQGKKQNKTKIGKLEKHLKPTCLYSNILFYYRLKNY